MGLSVFALAAIALCGVTLISSCVAVGIRPWVHFEPQELVKVNYGLWTKCVIYMEKENCTKIDSSDVPSYGQYRAIKATRAFVILGILVLPGAVVVGLLVLFVMPEKKNLFVASAACACAAGFFHLVGIGVFAGEVMDYKYMEDFKYGVGFILTIVVGIMSWVSGGLFVAAKMISRD